MGILSNGGSHITHLELCKSFASMHSIQTPSYFKALFLGGCLHHAEVVKIIPLGTHLASLTLTQTGRGLVSADTKRVAHGTSTMQTYPSREKGVWQRDYH
jgi:hypothetical protein